MPEQSLTLYRSQGPPLADTQGDLYDTAFVLPLHPPTIQTTNTQESNKNTLFIIKFTKNNHFLALSIYSNSVVETIISSPLSIKSGT